MKEIVIIRDHVGSYFAEMEIGSHPYKATCFPQKAYRFLSEQAAMCCIEEIIAFYAEHLPETKLFMKIEKFYAND
jgi:hypothetical protein